MRSCARFGVDFRFAVERRMRVTKYNSIDDVQMVIGLDGWEGVGYRPQNP